VVKLDRTGAQPAIGEGEERILKIGSEPVGPNPAEDHVDRDAVCRLEGADEGAMPRGAQREFAR
jgi:hypothetical protein